MKNSDSNQYETRLIQTAQAIKMFSKLESQKTELERRYKSKDYFAGEMPQLQKPSVSALSDAELFAELQKRGVSIPAAQPEKETAKRGRKPAAESEVLEPIETSLDNAEIKPESAE